MKRNGLFGLSAIALCSFIVLSARPSHAQLHRATDPVMTPASSIVLQDDALVIDVNLARVVAHHEPERGNKPELSDAERILAAEAARREAIFEQSVTAEKTRGDALSRRFEEALRQARDEPVTKPTRDFDLDLGVKRGYGSAALGEAILLGLAARW